MSTKSERMPFGDRYDVPVPSGNVWTPEEELSCPRADEVFRDIAVTVASVLAIAALVNLLLDAFGV